MVDSVQGKDTEPFWNYYEEADYKALKDALSKIRFAGNNADAAEIWMQKVAAHAMEPEKWPDPGPQFADDAASRDGGVGGA